MKNIYMPSVACNYYVDIARHLNSLGHNVKVIGAGKSKENWPTSLDEYVSATKPKITFWENFNTPESLESIFDPDYSTLSLELFSRLAYYEKLFLLSTDRAAFFPIAQIDRCRLFYRYVGHFSKILCSEKIDSVIFFGTPHGPWSIALLGLAKALGLQVLYVDWVGLSPHLSTIETDIHVTRAYSAQEMKLGLAANGDELARIHELVVNGVNADFVWNAGEHLDLTRVYLRRIASLLLRNPFEDYVTSEFFLNRGNRKRIGYVVPLIKYFISVNRALRFYDENTTDELPDGNSVVLFLHQQPEASSMPVGGIFADQLLILDLILTALPQDVNVYVKEHPFMFESPAQERHERSVEFYSHMLKDPRVRFVKRSVNSNLLMSKAGYVTSVCGSVSWEAIRAGKPCIVFGWAWYSACRSCFSVDSVASLKAAFLDAAGKSKEEVFKDLNDFLAELEPRIIYAAANRPALSYLGNDYSYGKDVVNLSRAIDLLLDQAKA